MTTTGLDGGIRYRRLRAIWAGTLVAVPVVGLVGLLLGARGMTDLPAPSALAMGVVIVAETGAYLLMRRVGDRALLTAASNGELRALYTRRFMVAASIALGPALVGFGFAVALGVLGPYVVGAVVSLMLLFHGGPRDGDLRRLDDRLLREGKPFRVSAAVGA